MKTSILTFIFSIMFLISIGQSLNDGSLVKTNDSPEIYLIMNQHLHHIPSINILENIFINSPKIQIVSPMTLELLPKGSPLKKGRLIMASSTAIFLQYDMVKIHIPNPETFNSYSFDWNKPVKLSDEEIIKFKTLAPIQSLEHQLKYIEPKPCGTRD